MSGFDAALPVILRHECAPACVQGDHAACFVNAPDDPGGATCCGIIQRTYDAYRDSRQLPRQSVRFHSMDERAELYRTRFWIRGMCDRLASPLAIIHFDACVNHGTEPANANGKPKINAGRLLQLAARATPVDGIIGLVTLAAVSAMPKAELCYRYLLERIFRYDDLADANPKLVKYEVGAWEERVEDCYHLVTV